MAVMLLAAMLAGTDRLIVTLPDGTEIATAGATLYPDAAILVLNEAPIFDDGFEDD